MKTTLLTLALLLIAFFGTAQNHTGGRDAYLKMAKYLAQGNGVWVSKNPKYDSTQKYSAVEFELNFFWDEERQMLWDSVTVRFKQLDYLSWVSTWAWHPQKKVVEYTSHGPEGRLIFGETKVTNDSTFITIDKLFEPDGSYKELKDENFMMSPTRHRNISYEMKNGKWEAQGTYTWNRKT